MESDEGKKEEKNQSIYSSPSNINKPKEEDEKTEYMDVDEIDDEEPLFDHRIKRFKWLDQYRGFIVILFIIALMNFYLSGDWFTGELPVGATYFNHGYMLSPTLTQRFDQEFPPMITLMDIGQGSLIFLVGFLQAYSFKKRDTLMSRRNAIKHGFYRFGIFMGLSIFLYDSILGWGWFRAIFDEVIPNLAWATLIPPLFLLISKKGRHLTAISITIIAVHFILYSFPTIRDWNIGEGRKYFMVPWRTINLIAVAIMGAAFEDWFINDKGEVDKEGLGKKIIPASFWFFVATYLVDYLQWADQQRCTAAMAFLIIGWTGITMFLAHQIGENNYFLKPLVLLGKNMFVFFFTAPLIVLTLTWFFEDIMRSNVVLGLILGGITPILIIIIIAYILERKNIILKI